MTITATELKRNLGKYLLLSAQEDIKVTKNGIVISILTTPHQHRIDALNSLIGILPENASLSEAREDRLNKI